MTTEQLISLSKSADPNVQELLKEYKLIMASPYLDSYLSRIEMIRSVNEEIKNDPPSIKANKKDDQSFDRALAYAKMLPELLKGTEEIKKLLTEEEHAQVSESDSLKKSKEKNKMMAI